MWANEQALTSGLVLLLGSVVGIAGLFNRWQLGIYGLIASLLIIVMEWPRSKRKKGSTMERQFQRPFTVLVDKMGLVGRNYFVRFAAYLLMCIPCCFTLATLLGGLSLLCAGAIYFLAAMKGEEWMPVEFVDDEDGTKKRVKSLHPPKKAPPRPNNKDVNVDTENINMEIVEENTEAARSRPTRPPPESGITDSAPTSPQTGATKPTRPPPRPKTSSRDGIQDTG